MSRRDDLLARAKELKIDHKGNISNKDLEALIAATDAPATGDAGTGDSGTQTTTPPPDLGDQGQRGPAGEVVVVTGPKKGRWRGGRRFTKEPVTIPMSDLTSDAIKALESDPKLTVVLPDALTA